MRTVVLGSVVAHAGVLLALRGLPDVPTVRRPARAPVSVEVRVAPAPVPAASPAAESVGPSAAASTGASVAPPRPRSHPTATEAPAAAAEPESHMSLGMRASPVAPRPQDAVTHVDEAPAPARTAPTGPTREDVGAVVAEDGRVTFVTPSSQRPQLEVPCPSCVGRELAHDVEVWSKDPYEYQRHLDEHVGNGTLGKPMISAAPSSDIGNPTPAHTEWMIFVPLLRGHASFDGETRPDRMHQDAYLDASRDERALLAGRARARALAAALTALPHRLDEIWRDTRRPARERRRLIFELWDELADDEDAAPARARLLEFVRTRLPQGGPDAYSDAELDALERTRRGTTPFRPY